MHTIRTHDLLTDDGKSVIIFGIVRILVYELLYDWMQRTKNLYSPFFILAIIAAKVKNGHGLIANCVSASDREQQSLIIPAAGVLRSYSNAVISGHRVAGRERGQYLPWGWVVTWVLPEMSLSVACATFACRSRDRGATPRIPTPLSPACCCAFHQTFNRPRIARHVFMGLCKLHHLARPSYFGRPSLTDNQNSIDTGTLMGLIMDASIEMLCF